MAPHDVEAAVSALRQFVEDRDRSIQFGKEGYRRVRSNYLPEHFCKRLKAYIYD